MSTVFYSNCPASMRCVVEMYCDRNGIITDTVILPAERTNGVPLLVKKIIFLSLQDKFLLVPLH